MDEFRVESAVWNAGPGGKRQVTGGVTSKDIALSLALVFPLCFLAAVI